MDRKSLEGFFHHVETRLKQWENKFGMYNAGSLKKKLTPFQKFVLRLIGLPIVWDIVWDKLHDGTEKKES